MMKNIGIFLILSFLLNACIVVEEESTNETETSSSSTNTIDTTVIDISIDIGEIYFQNRVWASIRADALEHELGYEAINSAGVVVGYQSSELTIFTVNEKLLGECLLRDGSGVYNGKLVGACDLLETNRISNIGEK